MNKKTLSKLVSAALLAATLFTVPALLNTTTVSAAYQLSDEVSNPPIALKEASEIGIRHYKNPALQNLPNKDAIVVMSFGTTFKDTRAKTITATVNEIKKDNPSVHVVTAFTSHIIVNRIKKNEGITYPTPEEAMEQLKEQGYTRVALVSLDMIPGLEYNYQAGVYKQFKKDFKALTLSTPAMYWMGQEGQVDDVKTFVKALEHQFPHLNNDDAILIMAHGTPDPSNAYYSVIQNRINELNLKNTYIYTVEGSPRLENIIPKLKKDGIKHIYLMPMMMVAGDHATNDMAGDEDDSHKIILQNDGFAVTPYLHGLGENEQIRHIFVDHADHAFDTLIEKH